MSAQQTVESWGSDGISQRAGSLFSQTPKEPHRTTESKATAQGKVIVTVPSSGRVFPLILPWPFPRASWMWDSVVCWTIQHSGRKNLEPLIQPVNTLARYNSSNSVNMTAVSLLQVRKLRHRDMKEFGSVSQSVAESSQCSLVTESNF